MATQGQTLATADRPPCRECRWYIFGLRLALYGWTIDGCGADPQPNERVPEAPSCRRFERGPRTVA